MGKSTISMAIFNIYVKITGGYSNEFPFLLLPLLMGKKSQFDANRVYFFDA